MMNRSDDSKQKLNPELETGGSSLEVRLLLNRLFSPRQIELILKRLEGRKFTKTEREYYSRVVRKKLKAIANRQVIAIAERLIQK